MPPAHTVCITAHHVPGRIPYLTTVLGAVLKWDRCTADVRIVTNSKALATDARVRDFEERFRERDFTLRCVVADRLEHPYHLTWYHKRYLAEWIEAAAQDDLFIYLEDDVVLGCENLSHFNQYLPVLKPLGLIPGFLRIERLPGGDPVLLDLIRPEFYGHRNSVRIGDRIAHVCRNPFWGGYILDRELAAEHVRSRSFDLERSRFVPWDLRARAAMGLCFEKVPRGFSARHAVVLNGGRPVDAALVWHCPNTYVRARHPHYARLRVDDAFVTGPALSFHIDRVRHRIATSAIRRREIARGVDPSGGLSARR